jgi:hypothetical protein
VVSDVLAVFLRLPYGADFRASVIVADVFIMIKWTKIQLNICPFSR